MEYNEYNHMVNSTRVCVEHSIERFKHYALLTHPYDVTTGPFNYKFSVIIGLVNLHLL